MLNTELALTTQILLGHMLCLQEAHLLKVKSNLSTNNFNLLTDKRT